MLPRAITVRLAGPADARALAAMSRDLIESGLGWRYSPPRIAALIADPDTVVLVACDSAGPQGFAVMQFGDERAHLVLLCVRPAQRRQGIARHLVEWLTASARVAGVGSLQLELRTDNAVARAFYRSLGFTETEIVPGYYAGRISALRMQRVLRPPDTP